MAMTATPVFVQNPIVSMCLVQNAVTQRGVQTTPFTNMVDLTTTSTNGLRVSAIKVKAAGTVAAGVVSIWLHDGTNARLFDEFTVTATTPSNTAGAFEAIRVYDTSAQPPINLQPGWKLMASTTVTQDLNVIAFGFAY